jgi:predicted metalloprotease with PDZ domain
MPLPYVIVLPEEISIPEEKKDELMDVELPAIPLLPADFVWMVRYEGLEGKQARMGVSLAAGDNEVLVEGVLPGSPAEKAGILRGDRILLFDGKRVPDVADLVLRVREKQLGDEVSVVIRRDGAEKELRLKFLPIEKPHGK